MGTVGVWVGGVGEIVDFTVYLEVDALVTPDTAPQLILHVRPARCLYRYQEAFLLPRVLQDDGKSVVDRTVHATVGAEKAGHRRRTPKEVEGLVECVCACMIDSETLSPPLAFWKTRIPGHHLPSPKVMPWPGTYSLCVQPEIQLGSG
jgi:hypothetical protein